MILIERPLNTGLKENFTLQSPPNQSYWIVGDSPDCDILIPKLGCSFGASFAIIKIGDALYV